MCKRVPRSLKYILKSKCSVGVTQYYYNNSRANRTILISLHKVDQEDEIKMYTADEELFKYGFLIEESANDKNLLA